MIVNDIVVEVGNARYQDTMDRFVSGEDVPDETLRRVWRDTTQPHFVVDVPIHEDFFRAVRAVNMSLPRERHLRVLLGDPPIDWDTVKRWDDTFKWLSTRDSHAAAVVRREVLARGRLALLIYAAHIRNEGTSLPTTSETTRGGRWSNSCRRRATQRSSRSGLLTLTEN